jgi:hypothetical protein
VKKALMLLLSVGLVALGWHSTHSALDPLLLRQAEQEYSARKAQLGNKKYLTIIDFRCSLLQPRLFVYDVKAHQIVLQSRVSHAFGSGLLYATDFSNKVGSEKSCFGVFQTDRRSYQGKFGTALRVDGISLGVNDNARARAIVFHVDPGYKYLGYQFSKGCFMTSPAINKHLISLIQGRSLVIVYR